MSADGGLECPVCGEGFYDAENTPYVLWCGHSLCRQFGQLGESQGETVRARQVSRVKKGLGKCCANPTATSRMSTRVNENGTFSEASADVGDGEQNQKRAQRPDVRRTAKNKNANQLNDETSRATNQNPESLPKLAMSTTAQLRNKHHNNKCWVAWMPPPPPPPPLRPES
ncbi:hypothetical protein R1flu_026598 [Riccia fluitans]|uniref:RING-type domain-containing protein n=1 Tax=Riccia fluitans TaxID=41844 RepID=A0ABD1XGG4_9MARC